ncbi:NYN domain-containing protein [Shewanella xiamenensis]|uniref:NYN domain-containing protein n=1 Tax=Shewanella xiamenensis TaxID=332186 RepID=UPI0024A70EE0|nr:NYN domain-containing protein [Shewanella xiamenensis]MDI5838182.1 NYN domain-containing protein [Shewanella xiamenensis]MDI5842142.1 NYN domain-containing protein [Shewanella xiamenensis]MDI5846083.1 NYN domain-containing protein [Shewanella xiamenensis]MDI5850002.1 NYN domain-containing protein [Shewanella xiamenensis]MDI5854012.1 NYN domain-containing protein [Shewanella xiamenensis]
MQNKEKIAVFIDADNAPARKFDVVLAELAKHGLISIRKAYGNWKSPNLKPWEEILHEYAIQPIQQFDLTKGKNASDIALVIDVMDILYTKDIDIICLISSDCDFTPLVTRALADGKTVFGFGERKAPAAFVNSCSRFLYLDAEPVVVAEEIEVISEVTQPPPTAPDAVSKTEQAQPKTATPQKCNLKSDTKLINLLRQAIEATEEEEGWAQLGHIGSHISNHSSFDQRNYGFKKLSDLFTAIDLFEMRKTHGSVLWVRDIKRAKKMVNK